MGYNSTFNDPNDPLEQYQITRAVLYGPDGNPLSSFGSSAVKGNQVLTPGQPIAGGTKLVINCTQAGNICMKMEDGSMLTLPFQTGVSEMDGYEIVDIVSANTTAVAQYNVLS